MPRKPVNKIQTTQRDLPMFVTWQDERGFQAAQAASARAFSRNEPIFRSQAGANISVRDSLSRSDYNRSRPDEAAPTEAKQIMKSSNWAYKRVGIVNRTVNLMADFACQGIEIVHPDRRIERFLQGWAKKVGFKHVSERFLNYLYRLGNVPVQRVHTKLRQKDVDLIMRTMGQVDVEPDDPPKVPRNMVPYKYHFKNPLTLEIVGGEDLAMFTGSIQYAIRVPEHTASQVKNPKNLEQRLMIQNLPDYMIQAIKQGRRLIPLDPEKVSVFHYKKDDWEAWAEPMTACILDDLNMLSKLKLADLAALDGAISHVRLWKLGDLQHKIYPTEAAVARLAEMLAAAVGGGAIDIIWGPELSIEETSTDIYKFLGHEKYGPTLIAIYDGLGIPIAFTGMAGQGGATNNHLSVRALVERLEYGRSILVSFWEQELAIIQEAFRFRKPASIRFTRMTLTDEASEKALLIQLADRNLISIETIQERFGEIPELEQLRQNRERREMKSGKRLRKASQWHNPEHQEKLETIALQSGQVTPSQVGLDLPPAKKGEVPAMQVKLKSQEANRTQPGVAGQGRPKNSKDSQKRKKKSSTIQTGTSVASITNAFAWTRGAQDVIAKIVNPWYLQATGKENLRRLSDDESKNLEKFKYTVLCNCDLYSEISENTIAELIEGGPITIPGPVEQLCYKTVAEFTEKFRREPSIDEVRQIQASVYALYKGGIDNG